MQGPAVRSSSRSFSPAAIDALSVLAPTEDAHYRKLRPTLARRPRRGDAVRRGSAAELDPAAAAFAGLHDAGKLTVLPGIGYSEPRHVALHLASLLGGGGDRARRTTTGWLGRYLDQVGSRRQPAAGPVDGLGEMNPTLATARQPGGGDRPPGELLAVAARRLGRRIPWTLDSASQLGEPSAAPRDAAIAQVAAAASEVGIVRRALAPFRRRQTARPTYTSPVAYPTAAAQTDFPQRLAGLAAMIAGRAAAALRRADLRDAVRHPRRPGRDASTPG